MSWSAIVRLDRDDLAAADACATVMIRDSRQRGYRDRFGQEDARSHRIGALGEIAFAKYLGVPWQCHSGDKAKPDVAGYEVRTIPSDGKRVYLKAKANDMVDTKVALVLLLHLNTAALVVGWMTVRAIREAGKLEDPGGRGASAWFLDDLRVLERSFPERVSA